MPLAVLAIIRTLGRRDYTFKCSQGTIISKRLYRGRLLVGATSRTFSRYPWMAWPLRYNIKFITIYKIFSPNVNLKVINLPIYLSRFE